MLVEQRTYDISPGIPLKDFLDNYERLGLPAQKRILGGFLGYFTTEFGTQNQVRHFWAYSDLEDRRQRRAALAADHEWQACIEIVRPMIIRWDNSIMYPTSFSPIRQLPVRADDEEGTIFNPLGGGSR
ncbi:NIPSNAP family protein [Sediminivirga luteola]|nr:NIPSNAP family protein [Sediminivirga luteola]MCI2264628.1 NIPSNAP family protein [Sediminivirga luteola]